MNITNGSDFILLLDIEDIKGQPMRVANCASFSVRLYTNDPRYALTFSKRDIQTDGERDRIAIESDQLVKLESGVLTYDYSYSVYNPDFSGTQVYDKVKTVYTDFYWQNRGDLNDSENVVTWQIIKNLQDAIDACQVECGREMGALKHYVEVEYQNKLDEEIRRSTDVDIEMYKWLKELEENIKNSDGNITDITQTLEDLKAVDEYLQQQIKANKDAIDNIDYDNKEALRVLEQKHDKDIEDVNYRIDALKANSETIDKELDMRLDATERRLNNIQDSNPNTPGSIENAVKRANQYTDETFKDARNGLATEDALAKVEAKIPVVPTNVSAFVNDMNYITDREIFNNFYRKEEADAKHKAIADEIEDINSWAVRKDEATKIIDEEGNVIREMVIGTEPDYYTKEETDALLNEIDTKVDNNKSECEAGLKQAKEDLTALEDQHNTDFEYLTNSISEAKTELTGKIDAVDGKVDALSSKHDEDIETVNQNIANAKSELQQNIDNLEEKVDADVKNLADNYYTKSEIDGKVSDINSSIADAKEEAKNYTDALEQKHDEDIENVNQNIANAKSELQSNIDALSGKVEEYKSELEESISGVDAKVDALESNLSENYYNKTEIDGKVSDINSSIADAKEEAKNYTDALETKHDREVSEINQTIEANKTDIESKLSQAKEELNENINSVDGKVTALTTKHDEDIESVNQNIANAKSELQQNIDNLEEKVDADVKNLSDNYYTKTEVEAKIKSVTDKAEEDKAELQSNIDAVDGKVDALETKHDSEISSVNQTIEANKSDIEQKLNSAKSELSGQIAGLDGRVQELEAIDHSQYATNEALESAKSDLQKQITDNKSEADKAVTDAENRLNEAINSVDVKVDNLSDKVDGLEQTVEANKTDIESKLSKAQEDINKSIADAKEELKGEIDNIDLSDYYTKSEVDEKIKNVDVSDQLGDYAKLWVGTFDSFKGISKKSDKTLYVIKNNV